MKSVTRIPIGLHHNLTTEEKKAALGSGNQGIRHSEFSDPDLPVSEARC
jgi:hypothetical protein